jgi:hypothetical protein
MKLHVIPDKRDGSGQLNGDPLYSCRCISSEGFVLVPGLACTTTDYTGPAFGRRRDQPVGRGHYYASHGHLDIKWRGP